MATDATTSGETAVWHMNGSSIQNSGFTSVQMGLDWAVVGVGDTNRDGYEDIILQRASDGMVAVWTLQGIGDSNGDGREDILWQRNDGLVYVCGLSLSASTAIGKAWEKPTLSRLRL